MSGKAQAKVATPATTLLKARKVDFQLCLYDYVDHGGTARAASELGVPEAAVIKTLVFEDQAHKPLLVLMHGDQEVSQKALAKAIGASSVTPCTPEAATRHTGYLVGGISPFGTRKQLPVLAEKSIFDLDAIYINAGRRGALARMAPGALRELLAVSEASIAKPRRDSCTPPG